MRLEQLTERIFYYTHEQASDRPCLAYVRGDRYSLAVDAGYSERHLRLFYAALRGKGLPLPDFTVLTHWHFDHTLALHAAAGVTVSCEKTAEYLAAAQRRKNCCKICTKNSAAEFSAELRHFCRGAYVRARILRQKRLFLHGRCVPCAAEHMFCRAYRTAK